MKKLLPIWVGLGVLAYFIFFRKQSTGKNTLTPGTAALSDNQKRVAPARLAADNNSGLLAAGIGGASSLLGRLLPSLLGNRGGGGTGGGNGGGVGTTLPTGRDKNPSNSAPNATSRNSGNNSISDLLGLKPDYGISSLSSVPGATLATTNTAFDPFNDNEFTGGVPGDGFNSASFSGYQDPEYGRIGADYSGAGTPQYSDQYSSQPYQGYDPYANDPYLAQSYEQTYNQLYPDYSNPSFYMDESFYNFGLQGPTNFGSGGGGGADYSGAGTPDFGSSPQPDYGSSGLDWLVNTLDSGGGG